MHIVEIQTKKYVHHFLDTNFGSPSDIQEYPLLYDIFILCLRMRSKKEYNLSPDLYSEKSDVLIRNSDFYNHGWVIDNYYIKLFNNFIEELMKIHMRMTVGQLSAYRTIDSAIEKYREITGLVQELWSTEAIKKDFYRHGFKTDKDLNQIIREHNEKIIIRNLSSKKTLFNIIKDDLYQQTGT